MMTLSVDAAARRTTTRVRRPKAAARAVVRLALALVAVFGASLGVAQGASAARSDACHGSDGCGSVSWGWSGSRGLTGISQSVRDNTCDDHFAAIRLKIQTTDGKYEYTKFTITYRCNTQYVDPAFNYTAKSAIYRVWAELRLVTQGPIYGAPFLGNPVYR